MTTTTLPRFSNQAAGMRQLVLFPELVSVISTLLEPCQGEQGPPAQAEEEEERRLSLKEMLAAGQMMLW